MPFEAVALSIWEYVTTTFTPVGVLLFLLFTGAITLLGWGFITIRRGDLFRIDKLEEENDELSQKVQELEIASREKDKVISQLKDEIHKAQEAADQLQNLVNSLLEKLVDERAQVKHLDDYRPKVDPTNENR